VKTGTSTNLSGLPAKVSGVPAIFQRKSSRGQPAKATGGNRDAEDVGRPGMDLCNRIVPSKSTKAMILETVVSEEDRPRRW
jgi:hypothetical protein